jgi:hypothetical protein
MTARILSALGGRTVAFFSTQKEISDRALIIWTDKVSQDDICGNFFAQGRETPIKIGKSTITKMVVGQHSNLYMFPRGKKNALGSTFYADFFGRKVVIRLYQVADEPDVPVFAVLHADNDWMEVETEDEKYVIPEAYFKNLMQLKHYVSQASILTLGSAYQLFKSTKNDELIGDFLDRMKLNTKHMCRVWLQKKRKLPSVFVNPDNLKEAINVFVMENETFVRRLVVGATMHSGTDTLDLKRFMHWRALNGKKLGMELIKWVH